MLTKASCLTLLTLTLSSCASMTSVNDRVTSYNTTSDKNVYDLQQVIKNIALEPRQSRLTLLNPEVLNQSSVKITGDYSALDTKQLDTKQAVKKFNNHNVYTKKYVITRWVNGSAFKKEQGYTFYDVDSYRLIGSKNIDSNTETVLTKLYDIPKVSGADAEGKMGTGLMQVKLSKQGDLIAKAKIALDWSLSKVDDQKAQFCEISTVYYDAEKFGIDTSDRTRDCYLINQQGDILGFESDMTLAPKNNTPELRFITK